MASDRLGAKAAADEREGRGLRRRMRGRGIADPDPSRRTGILLNPPGYLNGLLTPSGVRNCAQRGTERAV
jgi:hypothetical protein